MLCLPVVLFTMNSHDAGSDPQAWTPLVRQVFWVVSGMFSRLVIYVYVYIYIYMYLYMYICIYIYTYIANSTHTERCGVPGVLCVPAHSCPAQQSFFFCRTRTLDRPVLSLSFFALIPSLLRARVEGGCRSARSSHVVFCQGCVTTAGFLICLGSGKATHIRGVWTYPHTTAGGGREGGHKVIPSHGVSVDPKFPVVYVDMLFRVRYCFLFVCIMISIIISLVLSGVCCHSLVQSQRLSHSLSL